jgi:DNA-directed RNA polymerase subunit K/omega
LVSKVTGPNVTALREIEQGKIGREYLLKLAKKKDKSKDSLMTRLSGS